MGDALFLCGAFTSVVLDGVAAAAANAGVVAAWGEPEMCAGWVPAPAAGAEVVCAEGEARAGEPGAETDDALTSWLAAPAMRTAAASEASALLEGLGVPVAGTGLGCAIGRCVSASADPAATGPSYASSSCSKPLERMGAQQCHRTSCHGTSKHTRRLDMPPLHTPQEH